MAATTEILAFDGALLQRGFWLYVWQVLVPDGTEVLYVGRTGDTSTPNAQSPFNRMGQHLGFAKNSSMLRTHLGKHGYEPQQCSYRLISHGPVLQEAPSRLMEDHKPLRNLVAAVERQLERDLRAAGYEVMNVVHSRAVLDPELYTMVRAAFAEHFPRLDEIALP